MLIASLRFDVQPAKRHEFMGAVADIVRTVRRSHGCLGCRFVSDCENENIFLVVSEWDGNLWLDRHLGSPEFKILRGTRILLREGPSLSVDEVLMRRGDRRPAASRA